MEEDSINSKTSETNKYNMNYDNKWPTANNNNLQYLNFSYLFFINIIT